MPFPQGVGQISDVFVVQREVRGRLAPRTHILGSTFDEKKVRDFL